MDQSIKKPLFDFLQFAIFDSSVNIVLNKDITNDEWLQIYTLAKSQGILGILFETISRLPQNQLPPKSIWLKWFAQAERGKVFYKEHRRVIGRLSKFYNEIGLRMMLAKGLWIESELSSSRFKACRRY